MRRGQCKIEWPTIRNVVRFLNEELRIGKIRDASLNGLQVRARPNGALKRVGFAVDACISTFEKAHKLGVNLIVVHHGIKWRPQQDRTLEKKREAYLKKKNLALYAAHLPLDLHREYGNNIQLSRLLGLQNLHEFGKYHGIKIGYAGTVKGTISLDDLATILKKQLKTTCRVFRFGKGRIRSVGVVSGGGGSVLKDAVQERLDCFVVGEIDLATHNTAREYGMNLLVAGHYATETVGVKALRRLVGDVFGIETVFIDDVKDL
ncbi:MAG TPA: Nif3-like dinuclear metal center hexameric protein [Nitrospirota bacterium]|nr:Nif3-like dinuclear metal center hexameric protein [Nitrospirota bacterium]